MQTDINARLILAVFEKITRLGAATKKDGETTHHLDGITAYSDFDGYTVYLEDDEVKVYTGFHNTFRVNSDSARATENFLRKMQYIESNYD
ncbi:DUF3081 family protein [Aliidiomarina quisquiliarum]|uniref:DUF3081 family protein n=1 Tax=Aliidiomarina quisquiliarum TaxID=2938947 RepID=UPI00208E31E8|nr:DUF3081 family protein [Aliidiomarina quisquiliarum]MCO4322567.1 DUF3081 domain-containing protein [Aliidiomarina quisquiliarum]